MIFYFSATGNSLYVAQRIAAATGDRVASIADAVRGNHFDFSLEDGEAVGFVTPTYFWGIPTPVADFIRWMRLENAGDNYVYHVLTYGMLTGQAHRMMGMQLRAQSLPLDGHFTVRMPDTWTPMFDLSDPAKNQAVLDKAEGEIDAVIQGIRTKAKGRPARGIPLAHLYYAYGLKHYRTDQFTVEDACTGCGLCQRQCPVSAIALDADTKRPTWVKDQCACCLGCLHRCPVFAIQYGKNTRGHGQYVNPNVRL